MSCLLKTNPADSAWSERDLSPLHPQANSSFEHFAALQSLLRFENAPKTLTNAIAYLVKHKVGASTQDQVAIFCETDEKCLCVKDDQSQNCFCRNKITITSIYYKKNNHLGHRSNDLGWQWQSKKRKKKSWVILAMERPNLHFLLFKEKDKLSSSS